LKISAQKYFLSFTLLFVTFCALSGSTNIYDFEVTVSDQNGEVLIGVNVVSEDQKFTGSTDIDGKIILTDLLYNDILNFSYIGYKTLTIPFYEIRKRGGKVVLQEDENIIAEIVVIGRRDEVEADIPYTVQNVTRKQIALTNSQTAADILRDHAGIFIQKSQMGGGSPVIRGFEANRVLLVLDGVRMNNAIYRNGHLQNAITVDASILERAEVIYGPGSLIYGSDALGGVVHYRTRDPKLYYGNDKDGYTSEVNVFTRYATANVEKTIHADLSYGKSKWGTLTSLSFTDYDDLQAGSNRPDGFENFGKKYFYAFRDAQGRNDQSIENTAVNSEGDTIGNYNLQRGTAYWQADFLQKIKYQPNDDVYFVGNLQYSSTSDIPRYDNLSDVVYNADYGIEGERQRDLKWSEWFYGPQKRFMTSLKTQIRNEKYFDKATVIASYQWINEERVQRKFNRSDYEFGLESVNVYSLTADFDKKYGEAKRHEVSYGFDMTHNQVFSVAGKTDITTEDQRIGGNLSRYPLQGSKMDLAGGYAAYRWKTVDSTLVFNAGLRYSYVRLESVFSPNDPIEWPKEWTEGKGIQNTNTDLTYGLGATLNAANNWQIRFLASKAFRSPNIDDFAKIREKGGFVTIPNPDLQPEKAYSGELTIAKETSNYKSQDGSALKLSLTGYYTYLQDAISRRNAPLPDPNDKIPMEDEGFLFQYDTLASSGEIRVDTFVTQANLNAENGFVYGFSGNIRARFNRNWSAKAGINYTYGRISYRDEFFSDDSENMELLAEIDTLVPLDHIPPLYGQVSISFKSDKFKAKLATRFMSAKKLEDYAINSIKFDENSGAFRIDRDGSTDNLDEGPSITTYDPVSNEIVSEEFVGTYGYTLFNLYTSWQFSEKFSLDLAVENITDIHYRPFASGVSGAGRSFIVALRGRF
jgi:hemoglobin/transferrin/lactoferrin receptor protein